MNPFQVVAKDLNSNARSGILATGHGEIPTPIFMPVGTGGTVKAVHQREIALDIQAPVILGNTYHLYLRPGLEVMGAAGGLHSFMGWEGALLTDSGGYQVFSLSEIRKLKPEGVWFQSHIDGSKHLFSPEKVIDIQRCIGSDIMMALDECTPFPCEKAYARKSLDLTHSWLERGVHRFLETSPLYGHSQYLFPIVQGSVFPDLRKEAAHKVREMDMVGNAIGGLAVGEPAEQMYEMIEVVNEILPPDRPRYLMGVGTPVNLLEAISRGVDMFDCVMPTRNGRNGQLFTWNGILNIRNEKWRKDFSPIDPDGKSYVDQAYSKAYLRHLFIAGEILGLQIASIHNLAFYLQLVAECRNHIFAGDFDSWKKSLLPEIGKRL